MPSVGVAHVLNITGLRFHANLGILAHEKNAPQPIQVDAELSLGAQPLAPRDDDIEHVLHALSPLGRSSTADDVASAVRFALENRSITGTTLLVDGGQHLMKFERDFSLM